MKVLPIALLALLASYTLAPASPWPVAAQETHDAAPASVKPALVISDIDTGGNVFSYYEWYKRWDRSGINLVIDAPCISACTFFLAFTKDNDPRVCMTARGSLGVHLIHDGNDVDQPVLSQAIFRGWYPAWLQAWIADHGGLTAEPKFVYAEDAKGHIRLCDGSDMPTTPASDLTKHEEKKDVPIVMSVPDDEPERTTVQPTPQE